MRTVLLSILLVACATGDDTDSDTDTDALDYDPGIAGAFAVGATRLTVEDAARERSVDLVVWYPAAAGASTTSVDATDLAADEHADALAELLDGAPCVADPREIALDAAPADGDHRWVLYSHCHGCQPQDAGWFAWTLASRGHVVVAPQHHGADLWALQDDTLPGVDAPTRDLRVGDLRRARRAALDGELGVGVTGDPVYMGHSFGSITAGVTAVEEGDAAALVALAAPMNTPLIGVSDMTQLGGPLLTVLAGEDNSITEAGNVLLRQGHAQATPPATLVELPDAGHWSVSDHTALVPEHAPGCGDDTRMTDGSDFTYVDADLARARVAAEVVAWVEGHGDGVEAAVAWSDAEDDDDVVVHDRR